MKSTPHVISVTDMQIIFIDGMQSKRKPFLWSWDAETDIIFMHNETCAMQYTLLYVQRIDGLRRIKIQKNSC